MTMLPHNQPPVLRVTTIGEFVRHHSCERRFKLSFDRSEAEKVPFHGRSYNAIDPVLQASGHLREVEWQTSLINGGIEFLNEQLNLGDERYPNCEQFLEAVEHVAVGQSAFAREVTVQANIGQFNVSGRIDFFILKWENDIPSLWIIETKDSRRDRTYHRIQVALYRLMVKEILAERHVFIGGQEFDPAHIYCAIARVDETTNEPQDIMGLEPIYDLERENADIQELLSDRGPLVRIINTELDELHYRLDQKCDDCIFNSHCFPETARQRRLELLGLEPVTIQVLKSFGITTVDTLADIDLGSQMARDIQNSQRFNGRLDILKQVAGSRRVTLPGGMPNPDEFAVDSLPYSALSQLPEHVIDGQRVIRIYLNVDYDYIENRLVALSAHITNSEGKLSTTSRFDDSGNWLGYDPVVRETLEDGTTRNLQGREVIEIIGAEWTGNYDADSGSERQLIQSFFRNLIREIATVANELQGRIHFYVWSRSEMTHLIEACSRVSSHLLSSLRELLGCRESLEQLIFSCLQQEVENRFSLGWTSRGLVVVTSLSWFGQRYHWTRSILGTVQRLDQLFTQDIFDFKTDLYLNADGSWARENEQENAQRYKFEVRSRFFDAIKAPYWYAYWRANLLPDPNDPHLPGQIRAAIQRYRNAVSQPLYLEAYLEARVHAIRWLEERVRYKNAEIDKPLVTFADLPNFDLGVETPAQAAIDFLRLDQHVRTTDWIAAHLSPVSSRVPSGETLPLRNIEVVGNNRLRGIIDTVSYGIDLDYLSACSKIQEGTFARITAHSGEPNHGQSIRQLIRAGSTCIVENIDWQTGSVDLSVIPTRGETRYIVHSNSFADGSSFFNGFGTLDESISDFVSGKAEDRLLQPQNYPAYRWFDPINPEIPEQPAMDNGTLEQVRDILQHLQPYDDQNLAESQIDAIVDGLGSRIQLIQGPPGTGKSTTTAIAVLLRVLLRSHPGDIVLVGANTHPALDNLLQKIDASSDRFREAVAARGFNMPLITISKVHSSQDTMGNLSGNNRIREFPSSPSKNFIRNQRRNSVLIIGGTTSALLKLARELPGRDLPNGLETSLLIIDEASMMVFPHFLSLATLVQENGQILLAGDHRQLAPIVAHDWEREDRPPVILYQPYVSAYQAIDNLAINNPDISAQSIRRSALRFTFRLPPAIRELIARLYRQFDNIELVGVTNQNDVITEPAESWHRVWQGQTGLFLILHSERSSRQMNELELQIVDELLNAAPNLPANSIAIVTPYRAQRSLLQRRLNGTNDAVGIIDTVERLQGGQRPTVIVSAVASDPYAISANAEFILNLNRSNVAFSRSQNRLIVVCSEQLINHIPAELENYESAMLWKSLRNICSQLIAQVQINGEMVRIYTLAPDAAAI